MSNSVPPACKQYVPVLMRVIEIAITRGRSHNRPQPAETCSVTLLGDLHSRESPGSTGSPVLGTLFLGCQPTPQPEATSAEVTFRNEPQPLAASQTLSQDEGGRPCEAWAGGGVHSDGDLLIPPGPIHVPLSLQLLGTAFPDTQGQLRSLCTCLLAL